MTTPTVIAALIEAANEIERLGGDPSRFHKLAWDARGAVPQPTASTVPALSNLVPGQMRCARCAFQLTRSVLYVGSGTAGSGDSKTEPCPNGCGPLWPVTWEEAARDAWATCEQMFDRARAAEEKLAAVAGPRLGGDPSRFHKVVWDALPVEFATTGARFEQAIRDYGVVNACEWFGYRKDDEFTAETIRVLDERLMAGKEPA